MHYNILLNYISQKKIKSKVKQLGGIMMNILITGGTGFIGKNLSKKLLSLKHKLILIIRNTFPDFNDKNICVIKYEKDYKTLAEKLSPYKIDLIIHLATFFTNEHKSEEITQIIDSNIVLGTLLLEYAKNNDIKYFINTSTYATSIDDSLYNPQNLYAATKKAFEDILYYYSQSYNIKVINLILYDTYGPQDNRKKFINLLLDSIIRNEKEFKMSKGEQEICYVYIDDVVSAYLKSIELITKEDSEKFLSYEVYGKETLKLKELAERVLKITNSNIKLELGTYPYKKREIMKIFHKYPKLPNWEAEVNLERGIAEILKKIPNRS